MTRSLMIAAILIAGMPLGACNDAGKRRADEAANSAEATIDSAGGKLENAADDARAALTPTPSAQDFVDTAAKSDAFEIAAARLAAKNSTTPEIKTFAAEMIKAHTGSTAKVKAAAGKAAPALKPDATLTHDQDEDLAELGRLKGAEFDKKYADGQVDAHEKALSLLKSYASGGEAASLKTVAGELVPTVEEHLKMARDLEKKTDR